MAPLANTIVAGGDQACDPHCRGSGPLGTNQLIIVDIFSRVAKSGYHGDMTRTYLSGRATDAQKELYQTVLEAWPCMNRRGSTLQVTALPKGKVITVESGLYYPGLGGVRVEDVVRVRQGDPELLSKHGYRWQIR